MKIVLIIAAVLLLLVGGFVFILFQTFGTLPGKEYEQKFLESAQYDKEHKIFLNRRPGLIAEMRKNAFTFAVIKEFLSRGINRSPGKPLPQVKPDLQEFLKPSTDLKVIWFGHSTFLLNLDGKIILVDPVFSGSASPLSFMVKRFQAPVLALSELPEVDYILLSHDHYDHLDMESIKFFKNKKAKFISPLGVGSHLKGWGIDASRITELDWWNTLQMEGVEFIATPAQHFSGRDGFRENQTLWASWVIRNEKHNIYFSGDSGYDTHFKTIGDKYGPFEIAFIEDGQYNEKWQAVHMLPEESVQAYFDLRAQRYFPVHWGMFVLAFHSWYDPIVKIQEAAKARGIRLISPKLGQIVSINDDHRNENWWEGILPTEKNKPLAPKNQ